MTPPDLGSSNKAAAWSAALAAYLSLKWALDCMKGGIILMPSDELIYTWAAWLGIVLHLVGQIVVNWLKARLPPAAQA